MKKAFFRIFLNTSLFLDPQKSRSWRSASASTLVAGTAGAEALRRSFSLQTTELPEPLCSGDVSTWPSAFNGRADYRFRYRLDRI